MPKPMAIFQKMATKCHGVLEILAATILVGQLKYEAGISLLVPQILQ